MHDFEFESTFSHENEEATTELFVGRRIVKAEDGVLWLDDGRQVHLAGNSGCWSCSSGNFSLKDVAAHDNVITSVEQTQEDGGNMYRIFVYSGAVSTEVATFEGDEGNGWYGTGYTLSVVATPIQE